jgi:hypothetical protein
MINLPSCKIVGVFGPVASGKTWLLMQWTEHLNRVVIFDATGEFVEKEDYTVYFRNIKELQKEVKESPYHFRIVYAPGRDINYDFKWVLSVVWKIPADKQFVVDEFHKICPVHLESKDVDTMLRFARHDKMGFIGVSQRIADVHKLFTSSCRMTVLFHTTEARDLEAIRDRWGDDVSTAVLHLRPLVHDDVSLVTSQVPQCVVIERGQRAQIFDFETDSYVKTIDSRSGLDEEEIEIEEIPEQDIQE